MVDPRAIELYRKLAELTPGNLDHVFLITGGSTAVDTVIRPMHHYQNCRGRRAKKRVIARINTYHGSTSLDTSLDGKSADQPAGFDFFDKRIHHLTCPHYYCVLERVGEAEFLDGLVEEFERRVLELDADQVGAFTFKPVFGSGDVIVPSAGRHRRMWELCRRYDVLYTSDEAVTSFGHLGHFFASQVVSGAQLDTILTARGFTSGYQPLGACIFSRRI